MVLLILIVTTFPSLGQATTSATYHAYVEPFFILYENHEVLADHEMLTIHGQSYFPLVDILKIVNGSVRMRDDKIDVQLTDEKKQPVHIENGKPLPKKVMTSHVPTFQESILARAGAIIENEPFNVMFSKNGNERQYPASTTKIMTTLIALEKGSLKDNVKVGQEVRNIPADSSRANVHPGDVLTLL